MTNRVPGEIKILWIFSLRKAQGFHWVTIL